MNDKPLTCDHCGRQRQTMAGSSELGLTGERQTYRLCHPDFADHPIYEPNGNNPDCYRLVTVYGEILGSRKWGTDG